jgi:hypothetical protein
LPQGSRHTPARILATARPMVRTETPNILVHSASLLPRRSRARKQETAEQWINEGKQAVKMTLANDFGSLEDKFHEIRLK